MEMKRHAVLLGNTNGLPGIHRDLEEFELLLRSDELIVNMMNYLRID